MKGLFWLTSIACILPLTALSAKAETLDSPAAGIQLQPMSRNVAIAPLTIDSAAIAPIDLSPVAQTAPQKLAADPAMPAADPTAPAVAPSAPAASSVGGCNCASEDSGPSTAELNQRLDGLRNQQFPVNLPGSGSSFSPAISINNPVGFGADNGVGFLSGSYQARTRGTQKSDGELGIGVGLFNATDSVGLELSYTVNSFGTSQGFGSGGFNAKLHKRFGDAGVAIGWNRFANIQFGSNATDYPKNSYYATATQVIRTTDDVDGFLSRIALTAGVGGGQFLPFSTTSRNLNAGGVNAFGSAAFRVAKPVSAIVEWTGQDLAAGLSITPFDGFPLVLTPAFRDISGIQGQSARFVLGVGTAWQF
jgi:hypothetical protein